MINGVHSFNIGKSNYNGQKRQENVSFKAISPETKKKAAEIGENAVVGVIKFGIKAAPVVKKGVADTFSFLKKCTDRAKSELNK
jgi:hypothetical protein